MMTLEESSGWLEIVSDDPLLVSSRTYNLGESGTFGQYLDGIVADETVAAGARVWLPQLHQNQDFRTNIGVHNNGAADARVEISLHHADGGLLGTRKRTIPAGERYQFQEPFDRIAGRDDIVGGYAVVEVLSGEGVSTYGSVIDNRTNDPTTVAMVR
jgi:hypothetical protein